MLSSLLTGLFLQAILINFILKCFVANPDYIFCSSNYLNIYFFLILKYCYFVNLIFPLKPIIFLIPTTQTIIIIGFSANHFVAYLINFQSYHLCLIPIIKVLHELILNFFHNLYYLIMVLLIFDQLIKFHSIFLYTSNQLFIQYFINIFNHFVDFNQVKLSLKLVILNLH